MGVFLGCTTYFYTKKKKSFLTNYLSNEKAKSSWQNVNHILPYTRYMNLLIKQEDKPYYIRKQRKPFYT